MDDVVKLVSEAVTGYDEHGNEIVTREEREIMCKVYEVSRNEFYSAAQVGLKPEITLRLSDHADYCDEKIAIFRGKEYEIIRVYSEQNSRRDFGLNNVELVLQHRIGSDS